MEVEQSLIITSTQQVGYSNESVDEFTSEELVHAVSTLRHKDGIKWIHFEGRIPAVLRASIPKIRNLFPWAKISIEFEKPDRPGLLDLLPYADIAFFSHAHLQHFQQKHKDPNLTAFYYFNTLRHRNTFAIFVLIAGKEGAFYSAKGEDGAVPTTEVDVVDATGAGDTFIAGFVWAKAKLGKSVKDSVTDAVSLATAKVAQEGFDELWNNVENKS
jgi:ketohexokinase